MSSSESWSPLAFFSHLRPVGPPSSRLARHGNGAVCRAAAVNFLGRLVARFSPAWAIVVAPVVSTLGGARAASRAPAAVSVSACLRGSQAVSRACRQCHAAARRM